MSRRLRPISPTRLAALAPALCLGAALGLAPPSVAAGPGDPFDLRSACREDFERLCAELGSEAPRAAIEKCLASHESELSPGCRVAVGEEGEAGERDRYGPEPGAPRHPPRHAPPPTAP